MIVALGHFHTGVKDVHGKALLVSPARYQCFSSGMALPCWQECSAFNPAQGVKKGLKVPTSSASEATLEPLAMYFNGRGGEGAV